MDRQWPDDRHYLGTETERIDGPEKVSGRAKYASDQQPAGMLYGMILRSPWPAARLTGVDLEPARQVPGIRAALLVRDVPRDLHYYGEEVAAVAGTSRAACRDALARIRLEATPQDFVVDARQAIHPGAPRVLADQPNVSAPHVREAGDVDAAFAEAAVVAEGEFTTQVEIHHPLEPHGDVAMWEGDALTLWASTQGIFATRDGVADGLGIDQSKVRVITQYMGGGFGSKLEPGVEAVVVARLAREAGAPVKLMLSRFEEALAVGNRPANVQRVKLAADAEGTLTAFEATGLGTGGFVSGGGRPGGGTALPMPFIYRVPNVRATQYGVAINAGADRPFRAPGHPQASFIMESILDEVALRLGMDPVEIRVKNTPHDMHRRQYEIAAERFRWTERYHAPGTSEGPVKRGVGCGSAVWGGGGGGTQAEAQINPDGTVEVRCGTQDIGTGTTTVLAVVAAEAFGLRPDQIQVHLGDTRFPYSGSSGGSTTAASVAPAVYDACRNALAELQAESGMEDVRGDHWHAACHSLGVSPIVARGRWQEGLSSRGVGGVQMAEVEVDTETGFVTVNEVLCVQDCGMVVNALTCESQVNGGIIMGLGYALYEQRWMDDRTGMVINPDFETYKLPGMADVPEINVVLLDMPERGVIGVGEPVTIPTAAAVANAVANALGVRIHSLPITPPRVLAALGKVPNDEPEAVDWSVLGQAAGAQEGGDY